MTGHTLLQALLNILEDDPELMNDEINIYDEDDGQRAAAIWFESGECGFHTIEYLVDKKTGEILGKKF